MPVTMEIMTILWRWRSKAQGDDGHIISLILIAYDVYLLCILFNKETTIRLLPVADNSVTKHDHLIQ